MLLAASAVFYLGGGYDRWQDGRSLAGLCHGSLDTAEVDAFLGVDRLRGRDADAPEGLAACSAVNADRAGAGFLEVRVGRGPEAVGRALHALQRERPDIATSMAMPFGHGRRGVLDLQGRGGVLAVLAPDCVGGSGDLVVTVTGVPVKAGVEDPVQRARFARIAARAADGAARVWGCSPGSGPEVTDVPADSRYVKVPDGRAGGTCAGLSGTTGESPADPAAPVEDCFLFAGEDTPRFRLGAYYPPFAAVLPGVAGYRVTGPAGSRDGLAWATAACPGGATALYTVDTVDDGHRIAAPAPALEQDALRTFATRSARSHGCAAPQLP